MASAQSQIEPSTRVPVEALVHLASGVLMRSGALEDAARIASAAMVRADMRGIVTHGVYYLPAYSRRLRDRSINPRARMAVVEDRGARAVLDADGGLGHVAAHSAMRLACEKAAEAGLALVHVRNSNHLGAVGLYALEAAEGGFGGLALSNSGPALAAPGGGRAVIGNSPTAYAFPDPDGAPVVLDISMGLVSGTSQIIAAERGLAATEGALVDHEGRPTTDAEAFVTGEAALAPVGGHKGFGLALLGEILAGVMSGAEFTSAIPAWGTAPEGVGHAMLALSVEHFMSISEYKQRLARLRADVRSGGGRLPGERAARMERESRSRGVPLESATVAQLRDLASELDLPVRLTAFLD
jgi:LDH2 family malate/lactate/ureidoglycolate dehydrogenase